MKKIVITGANGFIGKNLTEKLLSLEFEVLNIGRSTSDKELEFLLNDCDFCFHLAGEVRPNATKEQFYNSNVLYTKKIIDTLISNNKNIPILYTSTIHASFPKNDYATSKLDAEKIIEEYSIKSNVDCYIYRLPHLFGPGCKPNYNSAISTWIYNACNDIEINVFDNNIEMKYIHVSELIDVFVKQLYNNSKLKLPETYNITLGNLKEKIIQLKDNALDYNNKFDEYLLEIFIETKNQNIY